MHLRFLKNIIVFATALIITNNLYAQPFAFSHYKLGRGLPANLLMQDKKGFLWIGSDGLFKFDGINATYFYNDPKIPNSLVNNSIESLAEDTDGTIWIGTLNGISHYNPSSNSFNNYIHNDNDSTSINTNSDNVVFVDNEGTVWAGNREGISKFNKQQQKFKHYDLAGFQKAGRLKGKFITCIIDDKTNKDWLWLASYDGLIHFRKNDGYAVYYYPFDKAVTLTKIFIDSHQTLWIGTWGSGFGIFNQHTNTFAFNLFEKDQQMGTTNIIFGLKEKPVTATKSIFYVSTNLGFTSFVKDDFQDETPPVLEHFLQLNPNDIKGIGGLPNDILIDKQGIAWVATSNDLSYILPNSQVFINHQSNTLPVGAINTITKDKDERGQTFYWLSSWYSNGLLRCNADFSSAQKINYFDNLIHSKDATQINETLPVQHQLWVATMDGLFLYNKLTKQSNVFQQNNQDSLLPSNRVYALCADRLNRLWIGTYNNGFAVIDMHALKHVSVSNKLIQQCARKKVSVIYEDSKGFIWMSDADDLLKINETNLQFTVYKHIPGNLHSLAGGSPTQIIEDNNHHIWISTHEGLDMYNEAADNFNLYTTSDGLSNNSTESLACDDHNNLWIATAKGLSRLNLKSFHIKTYFNEDGINSDDKLSFLLSSEGKIIIGGDKFIITFNPLSLTKNVTAPPVYINSITLNNKNKSFITKSPNEKITLAYNENYFTLDFIALNFINATQNKYACKLEGLDKNFIQSGNMHKAVYTNVAPGTYTFKVKAGNNDDVWNNAGASIIIQINPPFWKTWWFIALCIMLIVLAVYSIYRYRINQLLRIERLRTKISTDLHDDIGSTLSSISILSDIAMRQKDDEHAEAMLLEIKDSSINLMEKMDDIVWSINPKNDSLENLMLRIKRFAAQLLEAKNIDYAINISPDINHIKLSMETRQHLYLVIKESINNIIKHAACSFVSITAKRLNDCLEVEIKDNGKGFNTATTYTGNGLLSIQNRAKLMHAKLAIQSAENEGTCILVHLKIK